MGCFRGAPDTSLVSDVRLRLAAFGIVLWIDAASSLRFLGCGICDGREAWFCFVWEGAGSCASVGVGVGVAVRADDARGESQLQDSLRVVVVNADIYFLGRDNSKSCENYLTLEPPYLQSMTCENPDPSGQTIMMDDHLALRLRKKFTDVKQSRLE
jgi:hypothetical protein